MVKFLWVIAFIGCLIGGAATIYGLKAAQSAPQEASACAIGLAFAVIPYCLARAAAELDRPLARPEPRDPPT